MTYYWFILRSAGDNNASHPKPSIEAFSPLKEQWQYLERLGRWSVQIESTIPPSRAIGLFDSLTAISRTWINSAVVIDGEAVGGPWDEEAYHAFVAGYSLTYANTTLTFHSNDTLSTIL